MKMTYNQKDKTYLVDEPGLKGSMYFDETIGCWTGKLEVNIGLWDGFQDARTVIEGIANLLLGEDS